MSDGRIVYRKIVARMALMNMNKQEVARRIGMSYSTLQHKLCGESAFTLPEALAIKQLLSFNETLEEIFVRCDREREARSDAISC